MIPKKIHYIWLGGKKKSKLTEVCINSWKRYLPDYEIVEWNETNLDIEKLIQENNFLKRCYDLQLWAFVSDYLRLWILYHEGGIYLDTDVEVLKSFDPLLINDVFMGYEANEYIGTAVIGTVSNNALIRRLLDFYDTEIWDLNITNNPMIFKYVKDNDTNCFEGCHIYPEDYFSPYFPQRTYNGVVETSNSYTIHWYTQDWNMSLKGYVFINTKHIKNPVIKVYEIVKKCVGYFKNTKFSKRK